MDERKWRVAGLHVADEQGRVVASCYVEGKETVGVLVRPTDVDECNENVRLMAAAPELLEACVAIRKRIIKAVHAAEKTRNPEIASFMREWFRATPWLDEAILKAEKGEE